MIDIDKRTVGRTNGQATTCHMGGMGKNSGIGWSRVQQTSVIN